MTVDPTGTATARTQRTEVRSAPTATVKAGDSVESLLGRHGVTRDQLQAANPSVSLDELNPGAELKLPATERQSNPAPEAAPAEPPPQSETLARRAESRLGEASARASLENRASPMAQDRATMYGGPPGSPPPAETGPNIHDTTGLGDSIFAKRMAGGDQVAFGGRADEKKRALSGRATRQSERMETYLKNDIREWTHDSRRYTTFRPDTGALSDEEVRNHPWSKRFDANQREAVAYLSLAEQQYKGAKEILGKPDTSPEEMARAEKMMAWGDSLSNVGMGYNMMNGQFLTRLQNEYTGAGGRLDKHGETMKGYTVDILCEAGAVEWAFKGIGHVVGKIWGGMKGLSKAERLELQQIVTDERRLARETPESLYRKSGGQILHDEAGMMIRLAKAAEEGIPYLPGSWKQQMARYEAKAAEFRTAAKAANGAGDTKKAMELAGEYKASLMEAKLLEGFVLETTGHIHVVARGAEVFQKRLANFRKMGNVELVQHLRREYKMTLREATSVAADIRNMPDHQFHFYTHDRLMVGSKLSADVADRLKYTEMAASRFKKINSPEEFEKLMAMSPEEAQRMLMVDHGREIHAQMFAHHRPESALDWLEYGLDVNHAMRQARAYRSAEDVEELMNGWTELKLTPRDGDLFGITDKQQYEVARGWLKMGQDVMKEIWDESGPEFVVKPQSFFSEPTF